MQKNEIVIIGQTEVDFVEGQLLNPYYIASDVLNYLENKGYYGKLKKIKYNS